MDSPSLVLRNTLSKEERLHLKRDVDALFASGSAFIAYPLRVVLHIRPALEGERPGAAILVVVAKKYFKRANKRNRIKRLIRESYRVQKHPITEQAQRHGLRVHLGFLSVAKTLPSYTEVSRGMEKALTRVLERLSEDPPPVVSESHE